MSDKTKKVVAILAVTTIFAGYFIFVPNVLADPTSAQVAGQASTGSQGGLMKWVLSTVLGYPLDAIASGLIDGIVALAELMRNAIFAGPVLLIATLFDYAILFNVTKSILNVEAVGQAWGVMQGLANMFFILILLWIALATIFDFQEYTAKNLLPKLIIMALLINFSLVLTGIIVDFSNGLGYYFYQQINKGGFFFVQIMNNLSVSRLFNYNNQSPGGATVAQREQQISPAIDPLSAIGLGKIDPKLQSSADTEKKKLAGALYSPGQSTFAAISRLVALIMTTFLGIIMIVVLLFGIGFLIARQVTIMFLGIFSPLVFLANIMPQTQEHWKKWWTSLTHQAFFAPAYLFCLLATFKFLELAKNNIYTENSSAGFAGFVQASSFDVGFLFFYFLAAAMMIASLIVAQKMSIALGGTAVGLAQKTKGYMQTALKQQGAKMAAGTAGKFLGSEAGAAMARMPLLRTIPQAALQIQEAETKRAKERADLYAKLSPQDLARDFNKYSKTEQDALAKTLNEKQKSNIIGEMLKNQTFEGLSSDIQKGLLSGLKEFIPEAELAARGVKKNETRYDAEMQRLIMEKSRELGNIRLGSLDNAKVRDALKRVGSPRDWETLASTSNGARKVAEMLAPDVAQAVRNGVSVGQHIAQQYNNNDFGQYANTSPGFAAMVGGNIVKPQWKKPKAQRPQRGGQQGGQPAGGQTGTPQTPPPPPPPPGAIPPTARPSATYTTPPGGPATPPIPPAPPTQPRGPVGFRPPAPPPPPPPPSPGRTPPPPPPTP